MHDVAVITVNYKMREKVIRMLRSLADDVATSTLHVQPVVVDNSSDDGIADALTHACGGRALTPRCISSPRNLGFGRGNNLALRQVDARYYFLVNPDIMFPPSSSVVARLHEFMEAHPYVGIVAPRLELPDGSTQPSCMRFPSFFDQPIYRLGLHRRYRWARRRVERLHLSGVDHERTRPIDWATGAALFIRAETLRDAGYFDERYFMYYEDCDLCRSAWACGWPVYYTGDVVLRHDHERASAHVRGWKSLFVNPLTRIHVQSLVKYMWKWRGRGV